ncbi:MAG: DUF4129 domain-containing protein [Pirellula sp.]|jgi:hypothetical protein|nr:DUF4129 domain-containing protein [Pirellula sp.]
MSDRKRLRPESFDYFLAGLSPIFVIGMIGSLVYFLVCVLYRGSFPIRLMWILGLYTVASVLIARIAIEKSRSYSLGYMAALGAAMLVATPAYLNTGSGSLVGGMLLVAPLLVLIAVLADRITFDCTSMNEDVESNGIGLLQSLGLIQADQYKQTRQLARSSTGELQKKRRHNPGVWILYFALGALPLFAMGQLIAVDAENRAFAWKMVFVYLFSSLSLLVLIALLSLRKYLRDRNVAMDAGLASRWIVYGVCSSLLLLILLFLVPLPSRSIFQLDLPFEITQQENLSSSRFGWGNEGVDEQGAKSPQAEKGEQNTDPNNQGNDGKKGEPSKSDSNSPDQSRGEPKDSGSSSKQDSDPKGSGDKRDNSEQSKDARGEKESSGDGEKNDAGKSDGEKQGSAEASKNGKSSANNQNQSKDMQSQNQTAPKTSWSFQWNPGALLQWIAMLAIIAVACFYVFLHRKEIMAFIQHLLGYGRAKAAPEGSAMAPTAQVVVRDEFRTLVDPFLLRGLTREQIVTQLFHALEAWGHDKRIERGEEETPDEYVRRMGKRFPDQLDNLRLLGFLYSRIAYARGRVNEQELKPLRALWEWLVINGT